jgi:formate dehydrogenase assembly factor FdhD
MVFYTTGRHTCVLFITCAQMRTPYLVWRWVHPLLGHAFANNVGMTLRARQRARHYLAFTGRERLLRQAPQPTAYA